MNYFTLFIGTIGIAAFSWYISIRHKRYHGIPRFFVFESILVLFLLNFRSWFINPLSPLQIISWISLFGSIWVAVYGFLLLVGKGKPDSDCENTSVIVKSGLYRYIRHPLYFALFLLGAGIILKDPGKIQLVIGIVLIASVYVTAKIEEGEMIEKFGDDYRSYMMETKMFIPYLL